MALKPKFKAIVKNKKLQLVSMSIYNKFVAKLKEGDIYWFTFEKQLEPKTNAQLAYWFGVICPVIAEAMTESGITITEANGVERSPTKIDIDRFLKNRYAKRYPGTDFEYVESKAEMSIKALSQLISQSIDFAAEYFNIIMPSRNDVDDGYVLQ